MMTKAKTIINTFVIIAFALFVIIVGTGLLNSYYKQHNINNNNDNVNNDKIILFPVVENKNKNDIDNDIVIYNQTTLLPIQNARKEGDRICVAMSIYNGNIERRKSVRETWLTNIQDNKNDIHKHCVHYKFVGDPGRTEDEPKVEDWHPLKKDIDFESEKYKDIFSVKGRIGWSIDMTMRTMAFAEWVEEESGWEYDYFVMVDADFYLCIDRLMFELQYRPQTKWMAGIRSIYIYLY